jgi:uncharacterized membrane protein YgcG
MMINVMRRVNALRLLSLLAIVPWSALYAHERIISFDSTIMVRQDGSMLVTETLMVNAEGKEIRRGIVREFPTKYKNKFGLRYNVGFEVKQVLLDGHAVSYKTVDAVNGARIFIGDETRYVNPGVHVYTITYETTKQVGFFDAYDELFWNVTGQEWHFAIEEVHVHVHIPQVTLHGAAVAPKDTHVEGYTGRFGQRGTDYVASVQPDGAVHIQTTRQLGPHEGLSVVVTWPKGVVKQRALWLDYVRDNLHILILLLAFICIIAWYIWSYYITRKSIKYGTVIPLFYPPRDADPGALRYILKMRYQDTCMASMIVHMAVRGLLTIEHVAGSLLAKSHYVLKSRTDVPVVPTELESRLLRIWFRKSERLVLKQENAETVSVGNKLLAGEYERLYNIPYLASHYDYVSGAVLITLVAVILTFVFAGYPYHDFWFYAIIIGHAALHGIMAAVLPSYTQDGQKFKEEIDGFKMFLSTTETERLKVIGTPPTKTPELYERYLPYAIALDVEEQWSQQFATIFKQLEAVGHPYQPVWFYAGHPFMAHDLMFLNYDLGRSLNDAVYSAAKPISSSTSRPGSSSGSGGGGYAGGGGGGGGGGGW